VGLFDISTYSKIRVSGPGAESWLDRVLAGAIPEIGRIALNPMVSPKGKLIGDFTVSRLAADEFLLLGSGVMQRFHMRWFRANEPADGSVRIENISAQNCGLHIAGPAARALLSRVTDEEVGGNAFPFMSGRQLEIGLCPEVIALRVSFTGELGYELWFPAAYQIPLFEALYLRRRGPRAPPGWNAGADVAAAGEKLSELGRRALLRLFAGGDRAWSFRPLE
jgi:dimethylglycine dehydrogenase